MPTSLSAAKRLRQNEKRRLRNKARKTELKTINKQLLRAVHDGEKELADQLLRRYSKRLDQAASKNVLHTNQANRRKANMAKNVNGLNVA